MRRTATAGAALSLLLVEPELPDEPGRGTAVPLPVTWIVPFMLGWIEQRNS